MIFITIALAVSVFLLLPRACRACTTVVVGKGLTRKGGIIHAHLEDMGIDAAGKLWRVEPRVFPAGAVLAVPYEEIPQAEKTFGYWASGNAEGALGLGIGEKTMPYDDVLVGFNDNEVVLSCNWCYSREENFPESGIRRYALRQLLLERARTAHHGVELLGGWIDKYGQADWGGLEFQLSDPEEAWIVETTSRHWAARKIRDDEIAVTANRFTVGCKYDEGSRDLVDFAVRNGWHDGSAAFCFADAYTLPERRNVRYDTDREERVRFLLSGPGPVGTEDLLGVFQDRYEGTSLFEVPDNGVEVWEKEAEKRNRPRPICTNMAQSFFVVEHGVRSGDFVCFLGLGTPGYSGIVPLYPGAGRVAPEYHTEGEGAPLAWRVFRELQKYADADFENRSERVKAFWEEKNRLVFRKASTLPLSERASFTLNQSRDNLRDVHKLLEASPEA